MFDQQNRYILQDYQNQPPFSSFLPGIAGELGVPVWCYYNNRGQAVCSFGVMDKDHAIMEFSPAHVAYRDVSRTGFRTFCKINGIYTELFTESCDMHIGMSELEIRCRQNGLSASAIYFGIPGERTGALARILSITNETDAPQSLELLDGMSAMVPYGLNQDFLKNMTQLSKAWMQAEDHEQGQAYFRVRASLEDSAIVREVNGGNFCLGWDEEGNLLRPIVQPSLVFGEDTSLAGAKAFQTLSLNEILSRRQVTSNQFLCCMLPKIKILAPGESATIYSIYGQSESKTSVRNLAQNVSPRDWFKQKRQESIRLTQQLVSPIYCKTADPVFDAYARQTYLDNLLRGGAPMFFRSEGKIVPFHIYSRKHGDPEREYNYFSLGQEYFAQGNGNYRDVNQNRRCDVLFAPDIRAANIHTFFELIQTDGYNPLVIKPQTFYLPEDKREPFIRECPGAANVLSSPEFTPGQIAMAAEDAGMQPDAVYSYTARVICASMSEPNADFGEGYWCDHWTYNLDLIETYLTVYPDHRDTLLFAEDACRWYESQVPVNPRGKRYCMTDRGLRQYYALDVQGKQPKSKWMCLNDGTIARSSLIEKILLLCAIKTATLDAAGMGVEMEGGRPGWYDALNGLPGLLGSSMAESCELARLLDFAATILEEKDGSILLFREVLALITHINDILATTTDSYARWNATNDYKERYRAETLYGFHGNREAADCKVIAQMLRRMERTVLEGIEKAKNINGGLIPTYFTFTAEEVKQTDSGPIPLALRPAPLPLFLEGPVRYLKLKHTPQEKKTLVDSVRRSGLYDQTLGMYKVNESLSSVSYEAGRALAFTPGWLENESVWLHMEYKYLLELLKNGMYPEFSQAFRDAAVPFLDPARYGRSPLENVSFIASSANPDPSIHGRGFVARLSGSTAEFIHMWQILFFGNHPFQWDGAALSLGFEPFIPAYLMPENGIVETTFLGCIPVTYHCQGSTSLIPGVNKPVRYILTLPDGTTETSDQPRLDHRYSMAVRDRQIQSIQVYFS